MPSFNAIRSKLNRAIAAYLVSVGAGGPDDISTGNDISSRGYPNTTVKATLSKSEIPLTGLRRITVHISVKGSAVSAPDEPNPDQPRLDHDARIAATYDALMQSDDGHTLRATADAITAAGRALATPTDGTDAAAQLAANNADMADFTCEGWYDVGEGDGEPDESGASWEEILIFEALCNASNTD